MQRIFLIGPPGAGKTACGQALADRLNCVFFDTDRLIESAEGCSVSEIFAKHGEPRFRELERKLLEEMLQESDRDGEIIVFATGGGLPVYNNNIKLLQQLGKVVALSADLPVLVERVKATGKRPLLTVQGEEADKQLRKRISDLLAERSPVYQRAGYKIDTTGLSPEQVANEIVGILYG
jgi:shikimate kinase